MKNSLYTEVLVLSALALWVLVLLFQRALGVSDLQLIKNMGDILEV